MTERALAILLVEDEDPLRKVLARSLAARGYRVDEATTCEAAVAAMVSDRYDLLLLDVNLPDATGWDVLRALDGDDRTVPTIVMSAVPPKANRVQRFRPLAVLLKPFPIEALLRLVNVVADETHHAGAGLPADAGF